MQARMGVIVEAVSHIVPFDLWHRDHTLSEDDASSKRKQTWIEAAKGLRPNDRLHINYQSNSWWHNENGIQHFLFRLIVDVQSSASQGQTYQGSISDEFLGRSHVGMLVNPM
jgi:hypothetical protein